jgi:hypothetical protein
MRKRSFWRRAAALLAAAVVGCTSVGAGMEAGTWTAEAATGNYMVEHLDRGIAAFGTGKGMLVSWRVLANDPADAVYRLYRDGRLIYTSQSGQATCFLDAEGQSSSVYRVDTLAGGTVTGSDTDVIEWMLESGDMKEDTLFAKYVSKLMFNFWLAKNTEAMVYIKCDDSPVWVRKGLICAKEDMTYTMPITPERCNKYRYRIKFKGDGKLLGSARYVEGGTELNGSIHFGHITH